MGLREVGAAQLEARGEAVLGAGSEEVSFAGLLRGSGISISHPKLAAQTVRGLSVTLRGKGRAGPDFSVEKLGLTKTWIYPVKALDEVRRHARREERINLGGRILAALTVIIALLGAGAWMKKQRHGATRKHVSAAK